MDKDLKETRKLRMNKMRVSIRKAIIKRNQVEIFGTTNDFKTCQS
jgi:hypothetical protein